MSKGGVVNAELPLIVWRERRSTSVTNGGGVMTRKGLLVSAVFVVLCCALLVAPPGLGAADQQALTLRLA